MFDVHCYVMSSRDCCQLCPAPPFFSKIIFNILQVPESPVHHFFTIHDLLNRTIHESQGRGTAVLLTLNKLTLQLN